METPLGIHTNHAIWQCLIDSVFERATFLSGKPHPGCGLKGQGKLWEGLRQTRHRKLRPLDSQRV